jgi:EAL domain-containing protein (putative c-di-GMP-specific phosphodiesterase class I)/GGDEF domain-containing protein
MGRRRDARSQWRGWDATSDDGRDTVTSERLASGAPVKNRLFPKVRSWFALGTPLELLSPLSVARILLILALLSWIAMLPASDHRGVVVIATAAVVTMATLGLSMRLRKLTPVGCQLVAAAAIASTGIMVAIVGSTEAVAVAGMLMIEIAVFTGLYLRPSAIAAFQLGGAAIIVVTVGSAQGLVLGAVVAVTGLTAGLVAAMTIALVTGAARRRASVDPDTGLANGFGLADRLDRLQADGAFVVATVVLRGLSEAREALGHRVAAELMRRAVEDLGQVVPTGAWIARVDFDELVVAEAVQNPSAEAAGRAQAKALAGHLVSGIGSGRYQVGSIEVGLRAHVGLVVAPYDGDDITELIRRASLTARRAVTSGLSLDEWTGADGSLTSADLSLLTDLRTAADRGELWIAYQPQIEAESGRTVAAEALLRWTSPVHGVVPPGIFIPLAERVGLIDQLTDWVLDEVLDAQLRWDALDVVLRVSMNLSPLSLSDPDLSDRVLDALRTRGVAPERLGIEVTETAAVDVVQAVDRLRPLHDQGVRIAIDDFGTGYTSLSILAHLPIDELKVDQRFVLATSHSAADVAIVEAVKDLAHRLGFDAVAEGVEDEAISDRMCAIGFDLLQGYHFARPLTEHDVLERVRAERQSSDDFRPSRPAVPSLPSGRPTG